MTVFFKKICASKVLRDCHGNLIQSGEPQVGVISYGEGKRRLNLNHFGKFLQIIRAVFTSK